MVQRIGSKIHSVHRVCIFGPKVDGKTHTAQHYTFFLPSSWENFCDSTRSLSPVFLRVGEIGFVFSPGAKTFWSDFSGSERKWTGERDCGKREGSLQLVFSWMIPCARYRHSFSAALTFSRIWHRGYIFTVWNRWFCLESGVLILKLFSVIGKAEFRILYECRVWMVGLCRFF